MSDSASARERSVAAVLGPTNTGKTHYAVERMLGHRTGVIGLPLRLLAREVYERIVALRGPSVVALVTGEERIVPARAQYWVSTVEAMPHEIGADFVAVDEIQLCADPERGHVFTDRLLRARGLHETLFLGSETMRGRIAALVPGVQFQRRERFSNLTYAGSRKLSRLPERSAVVAFSVEAVYAIAELIRRQRGGAAVVMGALSPRTRNAQVALYQNGDVDYMVATDAIGMGLNLDVRHVAFAGLAKFDGHRQRRLKADEMAQIAGRAGRHVQDGTFGVTGEAGPLDQELVEAIESHRFPPVARLQWRSSDLDFGSVPGLLASLEAVPAHPDLVRAREADDVAALRTLWEDPAIRSRAGRGEAVRLLWEVCKVPDFRKVSPGEHAALLSRIYQFLASPPGCIPSGWLATQITRIDRTDGDIDAISKRLAYIRTWTYAAQRSGWVEAEEHWRVETRAVEDRLSDALHARLTQRFVDRRTSVLMRRLKQRESLVAEVDDKGGVSAAGQHLGRLEGFRFRPDPGATADEARTLRLAGQQALQAEWNRRADRFYNAPDQEIGLTEQGGLMWGEHAVGRLAAGADPLAPEVRVFVDESADPAVGEKVTRRLTHWINRRISTQFEPLLALRADETITGLARGIAFRLVEALGVVPREEIAADVKALDQEARASLRKHGVRFGQYTLFLPAVLKPAPTQLRLVLWSLASGFGEFPSAPPPGLVTIPAAAGLPEGYYARAGYRLAGSRAIRIDMLERLADQIRSRDTRSGFEAAPEMLSITGLSLDQFAELMEGLGYRAEKAERPKAKPQPRGATAAHAEPAAPPLPESPPVPEPAAAGDAPSAAEAPPGPDPAAAAAPVGDAPAESPPAWAAPAGAAPDVPEVVPEAAPEAAPEAVPEAAPEAAPAATAGDETPAVPAAPVEMEHYYRFFWAPRRRETPRGPHHRRDASRSGGEGGERRGRGEGGHRRGPQHAGPQHAGPRQAGTPSPDAPDAAAASGTAPVAEAASARPGRPPHREPRPDRGPPRRQGEGGEQRHGARPDAARRDAPAGDVPRTDGSRTDGPRTDGPRQEGQRGDGLRKEGPRRDGHRAGPRPRRDEEREGQKPRTYSAAPPRGQEAVDPDNPFAALMALKFRKD
jgi:ATP-dependent RNA helicase SUPV3L1/SUV3